MLTNRKQHKLKKIHYYDPQIDAKVRKKAFSWMIPTLGLFKAPQKLCKGDI